MKSVRGKGLLNAIVIDDDEIIKLTKDKDEDGGIDIVIDDDVSFVDEDDDDGHDVIVRTCY